MIALDTSALIKRYKDEPFSDWTVEVMSTHEDWCGSALLSAEAAIAVERDRDLRKEIRTVDAHLTNDLDSFRLVPVDASCLVSAVEIGRKFKLRTLDAIHLGAARMLPPECMFITFDERQRDAAEELGLKVLRPPV